MKIKLITEDQYNEIMHIQSEYKNLTYQAKGWEGIQVELSDTEKAKFQIVSDILKEHVVGFSEFNNFTLDKHGDITLRFQYNYGAEDNSMSFSGVGYLSVAELFKGFEDESPKNEPVEIKVGKKYRLRCGLVTSPVKLYNGGGNYIYEATVQEEEYPGPSHLCWLQGGHALLRYKSHKHDIIEEA